MKNFKVLLQMCKSLLYYDLCSKVESNFCLSGPVNTQNLTLLKIAWSTIGLISEIVQMTPNQVNSTRNK